jgi:hypothetical protein
MAAEVQRVCAGILLLYFADVSEIENDEITCYKESFVVS